MNDMGIRLSDESGENRRDEDILDMIDKINEVIEEYDFRVRQWAKWEKFSESCVKEQKFVEDLYKRLGLEKEQDE